VSGVSLLSVWHLKGSIDSPWIVLYGSGGRAWIAACFPPAKVFFPSAKKTFLSSSTHNSAVCPQVLAFPPAVLGQSESSSSTKFLKSTAWIPFVAALGIERKQNEVYLSHDAFGVTEYLCPVSEKRRWLAGDFGVMIDVLADFFQRPGLNVEEQADAVTYGEKRGKLQYGFQPGRPQKTNVRREREPESKLHVELEPAVPPRVPLGRYRCRLPVFWLFGATGETSVWRCERSGARAGPERTGLSCKKYQ